MWPTLYALPCSDRGLPERLVPAEATRLLKHLGLQEYANRASGSYSGGNRRKLSVAVALVGGAEVSQNCSGAGRASTSRGRT